MKHATLLLSLALVLGCSSTQSVSKSALETDPAGWVDLMPAKDLKGWKRVPIDPALAPHVVWSVSDDGKLLLVDGVKAKEMLLHEQERGDGVFHVEWRFRKIEGPTPVYNGGVYVRTAMDGKTWVQAQVAHADKGPVVGDLFAVAPGKPDRLDFLQKGPHRSRPPGEWNTYEIACRGKVISVWVNGGVTAEWNDCPMARGHVGLQAEFAFIEVRSLKFKPL